MMTTPTIPLYMAIIATAVVLIVQHFVIYFRVTMYARRQTWNEHEPEVMYILIWLSITVGWLVPSSVSKSKKELIVLIVWGATALMLFRESGIFYVPRLEISKHIPAVHYIMLTTERTSWRLNTTLELFRREGVEPTLFHGHVDDYQKKWISQTNMYFDVLRFLIKTLTTEEFDDWVVVLEDDAMPLFDFRRNLGFSLEYFYASSVVWLDTRNAYPYMMVGTFTCGNAGTAFRIGSLRYILDVLSKEPPQAVDILMARACNDGSLRCGASMLVREGELWR